MPLSPHSTTYAPMAAHFAPGRHSYVITHTSVAFFPQYHFFFLNICFIFHLSLRTIQIGTDSSNLNSEFCFILKVVIISFTQNNSNLSYQIFPPVYFYIFFFKSHLFSVSVTVCVFCRYHLRAQTIRASCTPGWAEPPTPTKPNWPRTS